MRSIVTILVALVACLAVMVHGRREAGQQHLRSAGSTSSASVSASSRHQSRFIYPMDPKIDKVDTYFCDVSALAARKPAEGDRLRRGEILRSGVDHKFDSVLSKDSTLMWLRPDCKLQVFGKQSFGKGVLFVSGNPGEQADHCALLLTDASCSTRGDLAIIDTDTGKYLWRIQSSVFTPEVDTFLVQGDGNAVLLQEGAQLLWGTKVGDSPQGTGWFNFGKDVREDVHSLKCDAGALQSSYHQVTGGDVLSPKQVLRAGAALKAGEGVELRMQGDCNLVVYKGDKALFATSTRGKGTEGKCALVITGDGCDTQGDLAIVDSASGQYIWRVPTSLMDPGADTLRLQGDGNAVLFQQGGAIVWSAGSADLDSPDDDKTFGNGRKTVALQAAINGAAPSRCDPKALAKRPAARGQALWDDEVLAMGQSLRKGGDSKATLTVQDDCNLVGTKKSGDINWKADTRGKAQKCALVITGEECDRAGDLALVDMDSGAYVWSVDTSYLRPTARVLRLTDITLSLHQQASLETFWWSDGGNHGFSSPPPEGDANGWFKKVFQYVGESQD